MTECEWWQAECARLRGDLEATERARHAAEEDRDAALELVAPDAVEAARQRDNRDAARLAKLATLQVALADAEADRDYWREQATAMAPCVDEIRRLTLRVVRGGTGCALDPVLAVDTAIATLDGLMVAVDRAVAAERARCASVCRAVAARERGYGNVVGRCAAEICAEAIALGEVSR